MATVTLGNIKLNWKGAYNAGTAYAIDDVVSYNGSSYVAKTATTGNLPTVTANWDLMSQAGTNGTNGTDLTSTLTTQGDILYRDGSGLQRLPKGTANQVLKMNSGATAPEYGNVSSDYVKIASGNVTSGSSFNINGYFTNTYDVFKLFISGRTAWHKVRFNFGSGTTYTGGNYVWISHYGQRSSSTNTSSASGNWNTDYMPLAYWSGDNADEYHHSETTIYRPWDDSGYAKNISVQGWDYNSTEVHTYNNAGYLDSQKYNEAMTGLYIFPTSGSMTDTSWILYGLKA